MGKIFIQNWGSFHEMKTLVVCGVDAKKAAAWMRKRKIKVALIEAFLKEFDPPSLTSNGAVLAMGGATILWLPNWKNDWAHVETLIHEVNHMIWFIMIRHMGMVDETDAQAYQQVYLFKQIRQKLAKTKRTSTNRRSH